MKKAVPSIVGDWRIVEMEQWDREYMDMEVRAFIRFRKDGSGEFQFGLVSGSLDCRSTVFTWEGQDEMDHASGQGWAMLEQGKVLKGRILFHGGDESDFVAKNQGGKSSRGKRPARD
jgi:hypothetical protein